MNIKKIILFCLTTLILALVISSIFAYDLFTGYPNNSPSSFTIVIDKNSSYPDLAKKLKDENIIKNEFIFLQQAKNYSEFPAIGSYNLKLPANGDKILSQLQDQSTQIKANYKNIETFSFLIKEGLTIDEIVDKMYNMPQNFKIKGLPEKSEVINYLKNPANFDRSKYSFLPDPLTCTYGEVSQCAKYYIEGFVYPATYDLEVGADYKSYFNKFLDAYSRFAAPVLAGKTPSQIYEIMTMASVVEKETGFGSRDTKNQDVINLVQQERELVTSVLKNRNNINRPWQTNPTATYGLPNKLCESTFKIENCYPIDEPVVLKNKYNTYVVKTPIGPIANPSLNSIKAVLSDKKSDFIFFIADKTGKTRFASTEAQFYKHEKDIIEGR
jgi:UPF0755 protein